MGIQWVGYLIYKFYTDVSNKEDKICFVEMCPGVSCIIDLDLHGGMIKCIMIGKGFVLWQQ